MASKGNNHVKSMYETWFGLDSPIAIRFIWLSNYNDFSRAEDQTNYKSGNSQGSQIVRVVVVIAHQQEP